MAGGGGGGGPFEARQRRRANHTKSTIGIVLYQNGIIQEILTLLSLCALLPPFSLPDRPHFGVRPSCFGVCAGSQLESSQVHPAASRCHAYDEVELFLASNQWSHVLRQDWYRYDLE